MVATVATASLFPTSSPQPDSGAKNSGKHHGLNGSVDVRGIKSNSTSSGGMQVKTNAQAPTKVNGTRVGVMDGLKTDDNSSSAAPRTFINQLPDWSMLLAAITTIFLAAEKQWMMLDWKTKRPDMLADLDPFGLGRIVEDGFVFRQNFSIRSYEIGADRTASVETLMNHLQETALNHVKTAGLMGDGFGSTPEMSKKNLFWVVTKMQVNWVMMNKVTRRLSKIPDEVRAEIEQYFVDTPPVIDDDNIKLPKLDDNTADHVRSGLTPKWSDLDVNQHVNNVKYVGWILESAPQPVVENYELASITLEYRR
ncbi:acyl-ACP thioesterase, partial [Tanacetum coccineum]